MRAAAMRESWSWTYWSVSASLGRFAGAALSEQALDQVVAIDTLTDRVAHLGAQ